MWDARRLLPPAAALALLLIASCGHDPADREYYAALRGEEEGMTREEQVRHLNRAIGLRPKRSWYWETRATYRIDLRAFTRAAADLDQAIALQDRAYLQFMRGLVECEMGRPATSLEFFDRAIAMQATNTQFYRGRSLARTATGDAVGGLADAQHLIAELPQQAESHYAHGVALAALGRDSAAIAEFDVALSQKPELVYPLEARAAALERLGAPDRAQTDRAAFADKARDNGCASCLDPFRY